VIIYTCITNGYDRISEENYYDPDIRYVCFYDGELEKIGDWEFVELDLDIECPVRRSYHPKHLPHHYFDVGEITLWIDGSYTITKELVDKFKSEFVQHDLILQKHPAERNLLEEITKLYYHGFSSEEECLDIAQKIKEAGYMIREYEQTINCIVYRRLTTQTIAWSEAWRKWYDLGVNRDQISSAVAEWEIMKANHINLIVDITKTTRVKSYGESYKLLDRPNTLQFKEFTSKLCKLFNVREKIFINKNKMLDQKELAYYKHPGFEGNSVDKKDIVIYTCITNGYDEFPEENYYDPDIRYVCFHDGTIDTTKGPWEYIDIREYCNIKCPRRLSFYPKANPHLFFPDGTHTVWIDGCYVHTKEFIENTLYCFPFTMLRHASRFSYYDEMLEGFLCAFFSYEDGIKLTQILKEDNYDFRKYSSPLGTIVWRTITEEIKLFDDIWYQYSLIGSNRDQVAFDAALQFTGAKPFVFEDRNNSGVPLGFFNKKGRRGMHPQNGNKLQHLRREQFLDDMKKITGLSKKIYTNYPDHAFYMGVYNIS
jgi:hypothetical protein